MCIYLYKCYITVIFYNYIYLMHNINNSQIYIGTYITYILCTCVRRVYGYNVNVSTYTVLHTILFSYSYTITYLAQSENVIIIHP